VFWLYTDDNDVIVYQLIKSHTNPVIKSFSDLFQK